MIFLSLAFSYQEIVELFDKQDGLRKIINEVCVNYIFVKIVFINFLFKISDFND